MKKFYVYFILYLLSFFNSVYSLPKPQVPVDGGPITSNNIGNYSLPKPQVLVDGGPITSNNIGNFSLPKRQTPVGGIGSSISLNIEGKFTCTSGFAVKGGDLGDATGLLLAGHCATKNDVGDKVYVENGGALDNLIGEIFKISYGNGNDFALIKLDHGWFGHPSVIGPGVDGKPTELPIVPPFYPEEGTQVCLTGITSGTVCGEIIEAHEEGSFHVLNKFIKDEFLKLEGLNIIDTGSNPTRFGDSGAGVFMVKQALVGGGMIAMPVGIFVGFVNDVVDHKESLYYPISTVLKAFGGLELITHRPF